MADQSQLTIDFGRLPPVQKASVLVSYAHDLTIDIRDAYHRERPDVDAMYRASELIHRLCGCSITLLGGKDLDQDATVIPMILHDARPDQAARLADWIATSCVEGRPC